VRRKPADSKRRTGFSPAALLNPNSLPKPKLGNENLNAVHTKHYAENIKKTVAARHCGSDHVDDGRRSRQHPRTGRKSGSQRGGDSARGFTRSQRSRSRSTASCGTRRRLANTAATRLRRVSARSKCGCAH
jgi:hypothetical protein